LCTFAMKTLIQSANQCLLISSRKRRYEREREKAIDGGLILKGSNFAVAPTTATKTTASEAASV